MTAPAAERRSSPRDLPRCPVCRREPARRDASGFLSACAGCVRRLLSGAFGPDPRAFGEGEG